MQMNEIFVVLAGVLAIGGFALFKLAKALRHEYVVYVYETGLLLKDGKLSETLPAGRHVRYGRRFDLWKIDMRPTQTPVGNQEVLTRDGVAVRLTATMAFRIVDAEKAMLSTQSYVTDSYLIVQVALRDAVTGLTADELLEQRLSVSAAVTEACKSGFGAIGLELGRVELRDITFPGELKQIFAKVVAAQKEGQAALERARGEAAAMRSLANTAKLLDGNPSLGQLRLLQALESSVGATLIVNASGAAVPPGVV